MFDGVIGANMKKVLQIKGLDCAGCAAELENLIARIDGVQSASLTFVNQKLTVECRDERVLSAVIATVNHFEGASVVEEKTDLTEEQPHQKEWLAIAVAAVFFILANVVVFWGQGLFFETAQYVAYGVAYIAVGYPILLSTAKNIAKGKIFDENFLMTVASIGAIFIGEMREGVLVMLLYQIGELLQAIAVGKSRRSIKEVLALKSEFANLQVNGEYVKVAPEILKEGDIIVIKSGEKVPVDGILLDEEALLDTKSLTGESEYKKVKKGEEILSGCINVGGMYALKVLRPYHDSAVGRILELVENAAANKAQPEKFIAKFAKFYTPIVCCLALALVIFAPLAEGLITENALYFKNFSRWLQSALTFLVISCPCALIISVPLTYFSGIGKCAQHGILVKGAIYFDVLAKCKTIAFDKTGTLTQGDFSVREVGAAQGVEKKEVLSVAAAVERGSSHPIAKAFLQYATPFTAEHIFEIVGLGLSAEINGERVLVGSEQLLTENGIDFTPTKSLYTRIYVSKGERFLGFIEIGDKIREEANDSLKQIRDLGIQKTVMLTGDRVVRAESVAAEIGIDTVYAQLLPNEKLHKAEMLKTFGGLIYVGDGINDTPVMVTADCAVSMGKLGSAAAVEASDLVLISDNLLALPKAIRVARKTRRIVTQNIVFSIVMKMVFMVLGVCGVLPLSLAVFADVGVMLLAVGNSFRVRMKKI